MTYFHDLIPLFALVGLIALFINWGVLPRYKPWAYTILGAAVVMSALVAIIFDRDHTSMTSDNKIIIGDHDICHLIFEENGKSHCLGDIESPDDLVCSTMDYKSGTASPSFSFPPAGPNNSPLTFYVTRAEQTGQDQFIVCGYWR